MRKHLYPAGISILILMTFVLGGCVAPRQVTLDLGAGVMLEAVSVPMGDFLMGTKLLPAEWNSGEHPRHRVSVQPFYMARSEVTVAQFRRFADDIGYMTDAERGTSVPEKAQMKDGAHG